MYKKYTVAVVMPCLNEEGKIGPSVRRLKSVCKNLVSAIVVVNDGSGDRTAEEAKKAGAIVITHPVNQGAGAACRTGFYWILNHNYDITVLMAGDDQDNPNDVKRLVSTLVNSNYDYVHGSRWLKGGKRIRHPLSRSILTRVYSVLFSLVTGFWVTDATNGLRAFRTLLVSDSRIRLSQSWLNRYELEPYLFYHVIRLGYRVGEIPVTKTYHEDRTTDTKMVSFASYWSIFRPLILLRFGLKS